jgi:putative glutamine amidotransferase
MPNYTKIKFTLLTITLTFLAQPSFAKVNFFRFDSNTLHIPMILPVPENQTPEQAWDNYFRTLRTMPDMVDLFSGNAEAPIVEKITQISEQMLSESVVVIANDTLDYGRAFRMDLGEVGPRRSQVNFRYWMEQSGKSNVFVLPMIADVNLKLGDKREFLEKISDHVKLLISQGGQDVDPSKYKSDTVWSKNTNRARDEFEIKLIKHYTRVGKGFFLGICRGSQIGAVALGYKLIPDLPRLVGTQIDHSDIHYHEVKLINSSSNLLLQAVNKLNFVVNSLHHQAVQFRKGGPLEISALSEDGVIEATSFKNGKGLLLQWHPELLRNELANSVFKFVVQRAWRTSPLFCPKTFL